MVDSAQLVGGCQWGWREEERRKAFGGKNFFLGEIEMTLGLWDEPKILRGGEE